MSGEKILEWLFLGNSCFFYHFRAKSQKIWVVCRHLCKNVVKNAFNLSRWKFWWKWFFKTLVCFIIFQFSPEIFSVLAKKLGPCCQNGILKVQRNMSRKSFLSQKLIFFSINRGFWADIFWPSVRSFEAGLSKLHSTLGVESLRAN